MFRATEVGPPPTARPLLPNRRSRRRRTGDRELREQGGVIVALLVLLAATDLFDGVVGGRVPAETDRSHGPSFAVESAPEPVAPGVRGARAPSGVEARSREAAAPSLRHLPAFMRRACRLPPRWSEFIQRGWNPGPERRADLILVPRPPNFVGTSVNTSHSGPYLWLQRVPLLFYGPGHVKPLGRFDPKREVTVADIAPTQARMMRFRFPGRSGTPISEIIEPSSAPPRLIVTVSIDGGGWNVLNRWPRAWPRLAQLMREGAHVEGAVVGSSPSITPAIHATMSTGVFPRRHGVTGIAVRDDDGSIVGAFTPSPNVVGVPVQPGLTLRTTTIADLWDRAHDNKPKVGLIAAGNYPLGLLGRGASLRGGDKDLALFGDHGSGWVSDARYYRKPSYVNVETPGPRAFVPRLDRRDGRADGRWRGHDLSSTDIGNTPAAATWEIRTATAVMEREGFGADRLTDLMYLHFKSPDHVGHRWNMISPEMQDVLRSVDSAIAELVRWLRENIGEGGFVVAVTADHGQTPLDRGGWPINREEILADIQARFDHVSDDLGIIQRTSASSLFSNLAEMRANGIEPEHVASFLSRYTIADNHPADERLPARFAPRADERLFSAVFPGRKLSAVAACTRAEG